MARKPAWILGRLTQIAFASSRSPIRTFVRSRGKQTPHGARAQPFPNVWHEGLVVGTSAPTPAPRARINAALGWGHEARGPARRRRAPLRPRGAARLLKG